MSRGQRGSICVEDAPVLSHLSHPGNQWTLRLRAPRCAARAAPGQFLHLRCDTDIPMRRPLSIQRADAGAGWVEVLYKPVGQGLAALTRVREGEVLNLIGPIGQGFHPDSSRPRCVLVGGGVGIPPLLFLAEHLAQTEYSPVAFFGSELPFPYETVPVSVPLAVPGTANRNLACLETRGVPGRLASVAGLPGCFPGFVTELARQWLQTLSATELGECSLFACGPGPMLQAAQGVAREFELASQLCLEEFMACAVGGCAGCAVEVWTPDGPAMRRVCVDGPVFDGYAVYPAAPGSG